jgi:hypothetical protein
VDAVNEFVRDRDAALLSMSKKKIEAYALKYGVNLPDDESLFWLTIHKARTGATSLPMIERAASKFWLTHFAYESLDDGDVLPPTTKQGIKKYNRLIGKFLRRIP